MEDSEMIYIFVSEDGQFIQPFKGSESEAYQLWDKLAALGHRITRIDHTTIWTMDRNPYANAHIPFID